MARPDGVKNKDHAQTRLGLLGRLTRAVVEDRRRMLSFNELAQAAEVSRTTLRHYFRDKAGVVCALIGYWAAFEPPPRPGDLAGTPAQQLGAALGYLVEGWMQGLGTLFTLGLQPGLGEPTVGPAFVNLFLEPLLQRFEVQLSDFQVEGLLAPGSPRFAALALVSPVVLALLHQDALGGKACRPLDLHAFVREHVERFVRAHAVAPLDAAG